MNQSPYSLFYGDPLYRLGAYKIKAKSGESQGFVLNRAQAHYLNREHNRNLILKGRQIGFTTLKSIQALDFILHKKGRNALILAHGDVSAGNIFDGKIKYAWDNLPDEIKAGYVLSADNAKTLKFGFDGKKSKEFSRIHVGDSARGMTLDFVHITELAYLDRHHPIRAREFVDACTVAVPRDGSLTIESTANGNSGQFYDLWQEYYGKEVTSPMDFKCHFYGWWWDDDSIRKIMDEELTDLPKEVNDYLDTVWGGKLGKKQRQFWYQNWRSKGWEGMFREFPSTPEEAFSSSVNAFYTINEAPSIYAMNGDVRVFETYNALNKYAIGADVALGKKGDHSAFVVWDLTNQKVVATYANNAIAPDELAYVLAQAGRDYGECLIGVENNSIGTATLLRLADIYPKNAIYKQQKGLQELREYSSTHFGWSTNSKTKAMMHDELRTAIIDGASVSDSRLIREVSNYGTSEIVNETAHYDLLTACAIGWQMRKYKKDIIFW